MNSRWRSALLIAFATVAIVGVAGIAYAVSADDGSEEKAGVSNEALKQVEDAYAKNPDLDQDVDRTFDRLCDGDRSSCELINPYIGMADIAEDTRIVAGEAFAEALAPSECPDATEALRAAGIKVDGYLSGLCPTPESTQEYIELEAKYEGRPSDQDE